MNDIDCCLRMDLPAKLNIRQSFVRSEVVNIFWPRWKVKSSLPATIAFHANCSKPIFHAYWITAALGLNVNRVAVMIVQGA